MIASGVITFDIGVSLFNGKSSAANEATAGRLSVSATIDVPDDTAMTSDAGRFLAHNTLDLRWRLQLLSVDVVAIETFLLVAQATNSSSTRQRRVGRFSTSLEPGRPAPVSNKLLAWRRKDLIHSSTERNPSQIVRDLLWS